MRVIVVGNEKGGSGKSTTAAEVRPRKDRQAQSDGRRVHYWSGVMSRWANAALIRQSRLFVGIGQRRAPDRLAIWAFPVGQLGKRHPVIAAIPVDDPRESSPWQEVHELHPIQIDTMDSKASTAQLTGHQWEEI